MRSSARSASTPFRSGCGERAAVTWETVVGLEIHVQLKTRTKMFCRCTAGYGAGENTQTCPVCLGFPGALPVMNRTAIEWTVKLGLALGCEIAPRAVFARKNYFYPDLPKGYQISQYDMPSCENGRMIVPMPEGELEVGIVRAHLEEDAAKTVHMGGADGPDRRRRVLARRLQPRRHAAARDRDRAGHPLGRGGEALPPAAAADGRRARHLRRRDGEGDAARRCQRLGAPGGLGRAPHALRDQEHELVQLHRPRHRRRGRPPDRDLGGRRRGQAGDVRLRRRLGHADAAPLEGGGGRLPLLPRAGPRAGRAAGRDGRAAARRASRARRRAGSPGSAAELDLERALVLVTGGLDAPLRGDRRGRRRPARGGERDREQPRRRGRRPGRGRRRGARAARRGARPDPAAGLRRGDREGRRRRASRPRRISRRRRSPTPPSSIR